MAHVIACPEQGMKATDRCDRCGAQAFVEVVIRAQSELPKSHHHLLFCCHHWSAHKEKILAMPEAMIADHTGYLQKLERESTPV